MLLVRNLLNGRWFQLVIEPAGLWRICMLLKTRNQVFGRKRPSNSALKQINAWQKIVLVGRVSRCGSPAIVAKWVMRVVRKLPLVRQSRFITTSSDHFASPRVMVDSTQALNGGGFRPQIFWQGLQQCQTFKPAGPDKIKKRRFDVNASSKITTAGGHQLVVGFMLPMGKPSWRADMLIV